MRRFLIASVTALVLVLEAVPAQAAPTPSGNIAVDVSVPSATSTWSGVPGSYVVDLYVSCDNGYSAVFAVENGVAGSIAGAGGNCTAVLDEAPVRNQANRTFITSTSFSL